MTLIGIPDRYRPGATYRVVARLVRPGLGRGGFELAARTAAGRQAGSLQPVDERVDVTDTVTGAFGSVEYARHTGAGSAGASDTLEWVVQWTAPGASQGVVSFHVAANAANDDASPLGDYVYVLAIPIPPSP